MTKTTPRWRRWLQAPVVWVERLLLPPHVMPKPGASPSPDLRVARNVLWLGLTVSTALNVELVPRLIHAWTFEVSLVAPLFAAWLIFGVVVIQRLTGRVHLAANMVLAFGMAGILYTVHSNGGLGSPDAVWVPFGVVAAWWTLRWRAALTMTSVYLALYIIIMLAPQLGIPQPIPQHANLGHVAASLVAVVMTATLAGITALSRNAQVHLSNEASRKLQDANLALEDQRAQAQNAAETQASFLASMSHEIRTPLNGVIGMAQLLADSTLDTTQRSRLDLLDSSARLLLTVINDILDFSRIDADQVELDEQPFAIRTWAGEVIELCRPRAIASGLDLTLCVDDDVPQYLVGDDIRLRQVLFNLVGNAIKFTENGGVDVRLSCSQVTPTSACLRVEVEDTGVGIPGDAQRAIFDRFTQAETSTTRRFGGTGLGLAIVKGLTQAMGGGVNVTSEVGVGSTFAFEVNLPIAEAASAPSTIRTALPTTSRPLRVLLVDDNAVNRIVARAMLCQLGHETVEAASGAQALELSLGQHFDVVLMDIEMPDMDGYETSRRLRARSELWTTPILALTAHALEEHARASRQAGMDGHLTKPLMLNALQAALHRLDPDDYGQKVA